MTALTNDNISDIKKNLSDRYKSDFPIIKELIQNADDAKAPRFVFGIHSGIPDCKHPLLQGVGLWCFNDGEFKTADKESIGSMGINAKAGESEPIGKFGLGMKSVFHWCESFLYIAFDKEKSINCSDLINPWNNHKDNYPHKNWEDDWVNYESEDIRILKNEFAGLINKESSWFLLWIPLRTECHLKIPNRTDKKYSSITPNRPGDKLEELNFLTNENLSIQIGKLLPLLANIKEVSFLVNMENWKKYEFTIHLDIKPRLIKPDGENSVTSIGKIKIGTIVEMPIWGKRNRINQCGTLFDKLKHHQYWPEIRYIDKEYGEEKTKEDKSSAEGAILISHQDGVSGKLTMQWAVFLPLEEKTHIKEVKIPNSSRHYHFVLHGQFFIDAGRLGIHSFDSLSKLCINIDDVKNEQSLRQVWNQALAQEMCFPLILPALNEYIKANQLKNNEIEELTIAFKQALEGFEYLKFICNEYSWFRELLPSGSQWRLHKNSDAINILPLPAPPQDSTKRPWEVLPCLAELQNTLFVDKDSAALSKNHYQWSEESILAILRNPAAHLFAEAAQLDYFDDFLKIISPQLGSGNVKQALLKFIREAISHHGQQRLRKNKTKIARVLEHIPAEKRWRFGAFEEKSQSNISDDILKALWQCESEILPIPAFLDSNDKSAQGKPTKQVAEQWLKSLHRFDSNSTLNLIKTILQSLEPNDRLSLIKSNADWEIVSAYDVKRDSDRAVSYRELLNANKESLLFLFAGMNKHEGIQLLQKCLSNQVILAIRSDDHKPLFDGEQLPKEDENEAILTALIKSKTALISDIKIRKELLKKCHYIKENNKDAKQGLRYLLHANFDQKDNANDSLWIKAHDQSSAWEKLQRKLIGNNHWQVIDSELSDVLPRDTWDTIGIKEIKPDEIIEELKEKQDIALLKAEDFSSDERNEILNKIDDKNLWCLLPWHKTIGGHWVSIEANTYLKTSVELPDSLKKDISIIEPVSEITEKQKWIAKLDETVTISIALNSAEPSEYQEEILGWLGETNPKSDLQEKLKSTKWLLLKNNQAISPNDIIAITGLEDVIQKLAASADYAYASDKDLHDSIIQHSAFDQKVKPLFATKSESVLGTLALLMNEVSAYEIGSLDESDDISKLAKTLADCEFAPSWGVIKALLDAKTSNEDQKAKFTLDDCKNHLLPNLNRLPEKKALIKIFDWLQKKNTQQAQAAYAFYLRQMVVASYVEELLPQIKLLAKDGKSWRLASELCIDAPGVDDSFVLCDEQRSILKSHLKFGSEPVDKETNDSTQPTQLDNYLELFEGLSKNQLLGLLLILIGKAKEKQEQIKAYLNPFHIDQIFNSLRWNPPILNSLSILNYDLKITRSFEAENNKSCESALVNGLHIKLEQQQKNSKFAETNNLLGNKVTFKLRENIDNLFIDKSKLFVDKKEQKVSAILYLWDNKSISLNNSEHANEIIRKTCRWLWTELYLQDENSLNQVFDQLSESHQLDIDVTRRVILKHIVPYLDESLSANNEPPLKEYLSEAKDIEFRLAMNEKDNNQEDKEKLEKELKSNQEKLILSLKKPNIHNYVLRKLREKLSDYQYEKSGIPFELFQNADDALIEMKRYLPEEGFDNQIKQFNIKLEGNVLYLSHWGRPINYRGTSEVQKKWPHFAYDLKKMLTLSASGKSDDTGVTGRFGLGFKSVFLACDSPKIISGDLKVNIVAGFLPEVWVGNDCIEAVNILKEQTNNPRYQGTLVVLPLSNEAQPDDVLSRFQKQQAMLCLTGKMLRSIVINDIAFTWQPKHLKASKTLEFGGLDGKHYLVFRDQLEQGYVAVIFHVSARGFELLKDETLSFWVVAPTRETASVGFVISAPFQIDAGRGKLAGSGVHDDQNKALAAQLGKRFGFALADLYKMDWKELLPQLGLAEDVSKTEWWTSLWKQFSDSDTWKKDDPPFHLAKAFVKSLLLSWSEKTGLIPNGLPQEQADLVRADSINHSIPENWHSSNALQHLRGWAAFDKEYPSNKIIAAWVIQIWLEFKSLKVAELGLCNLIDLIEDKKCNVELADKLGSFFAIIYKDEKPTDNEKNQLSEIQFLSKQDTYQPSSKLLSAHEADKEEKLRVAFAPDEHVLSDAYQKNGKQFFRTCRKQMGCADELEQWFISASAEKQQAALHYIIEGDKGNDVAQKVRNDAYGKWFSGISKNHSLLNDWTDNDKEKLIRLLGSKESLGLGNQLAAQLEPSIPPDHNWGPWNEETAACRHNLESCRIKVKQQEVTIRDLQAQLNKNN